jgi:ABC-2 type transport system permease protein
MKKYIFIREIQEMLKDIRYFIFLLITIIVSISSGLLSSIHYDSLSKERDYLVNKYETQLKISCNQSLESASELNHVAIKKISPYIFLVGSETKYYPNYSSIDINNLYFGNPNLYYPTTTTTTEITFLNFIRPDMTFIVQVIFSFMIILLIHDTISKEKEFGTLKLVFSNGIAHYDVLFGKILASFFMVASSLIVGFLAQIIVVLIMNTIPVEKGLISIFIIILLLSLIYSFFWILISCLL